MPTKLDHYANKYQCVRFERRGGILQMTLHTDGGSLRWGFGPHGELPDAFYDVGNDRENRVVIITGTGAEFSGPRATPGAAPRGPRTTATASNARERHTDLRAGKRGQPTVRRPYRPDAPTPPQRH